MNGPPMCRICGCVQLDCSNCIRRTGRACRWVAPDLCSACEGVAELIDQKAMPLVELARLIKRTLLKQQAYFKCAQRHKLQLMQESKDLERRLMKAAEEVLERANVTPSLFAEGGGR